LKVRKPKDVGGTTSLKVNFREHWNDVSTGKVSLHGDQHGRGNCLWAGRSRSRSGGFGLTIKRLSGNASAAMSKEEKNSAKNEAKRKKRGSKVQS